MQAVNQHTTSFDLIVASVKIVLFAATEAIASYKLVILSLKV